MGRKLVIVESPSKAKTIKKYLGSNYIVKSSVGHIIDLPKSTLGINLEDDFTPKYITVRGKTPILNEIKKAAKGCDKILLATDPDREGEAIAWHLAKALNVPLDQNCRVSFNAVTKESVKEAVKNPEKINLDLVDAQQARRILDRIVGYKLSPLLWKKIKRGLSAGRVQSIALWLIIDRESEIENFTPEEYWNVLGTFTTEKKKSIVGSLEKYRGKKLKIGNEEEMKKVKADLLIGIAKLTSSEGKEKTKSPAPPLITSTLQQQSSNMFNYTSRKTMQVAQRLYEGVDLGKEKGGLTGLITYMRTDSTRISPEAKSETKEFISKEYGREYVPSKPRFYKNGKKAQDAHEAIRPTSTLRTPGSLKGILSRDELKIYTLIWNRFVASEMAPAIYDDMTINIDVNDYTFKAKGSILKFKGFLAVDSKKMEEDVILPKVSLGENLKVEKYEESQHFTKGPARYNEGSLIKKLEALGIGRPSTYASILDTIQRRGYVVKEEKQFFSTELGEITSGMLQDNFNSLINIKFTAKMENDLDLVAEGKRDWKEVIRNFYEPFAILLEEAEIKIEKIMIEKPKDIETDVICDKCGANMVIKNGRYGKFLACPKFPECKNTKVLLEEIGVKCDKCSGEIVKKRSKKGRVFYGCSNYPECDRSLWYEPTGEKCPKCGKYIVKKGRGYKCEDSSCGYIAKEEQNENTDKNDNKSKKKLEY